MTRLLWRLVAAFVVVVGMACLPAPRAAAQGDWSIPRFDVSAVAATNGDISVRIDFDFDFGYDAGHGPYLLLPLRQQVAGDEARDRVFAVSDIRAGSPSGARADVTTSTQWDVLAIRIGDENYTYTGVQRYVVSYRLSGIVNPKVAASGLDEINWNAVGTGWTVPLRNVTITLRGPADVARTACYAGAGFTKPCAANSADGATAAFSQKSISPGEGLQVVAGWPAGTFVGAEPVYARHLSPATMFPATPLTLAGLLLFSALAIAFVVLLARRRGADLAYLGLTPGLVPTQGSEITIGRAPKVPVAVQFTPPANFRPAHLGTLIDERADMRDVTSTIVDLAVRGFLRIEEPQPRDWRVVQLAANTGLLPFEQRLFDGLFAGGPIVTMDELRANNYGMTLRGTQLSLYSEVMKLGWFRSSPLGVRVRWILGGLFVAGAGVLLSLLLGLGGLGLLGVPVIVLGLAMAFASGQMPARTADGTAVLAQAAGFKLYLSTAEAEQIRWEEGEDIFSRYLPYAVAFGCADRWAKVFAEIAASGRAVPEPGWYVGPYFYGPAFWTSGGFGNFMSGLDGFNSAAAAAMTAPSTGAGGGSGFGGGGGGVGGGGGGGW